MSKKIDRKTIGRVKEGTWIRNRTNGIIHVVIDVVEDGVVVDKNFIDVKKSFSDSEFYETRYKLNTKPLKFATLFRHYSIMTDDEVTDFIQMINRIFDNNYIKLKSKFTNEEYEGKVGVQRITLITDDMIKYINLNKLGAYDLVFNKHRII